MINILFLFIDGIGLGTDDPEVNPFAALDLPSFARMAGGNHWLRSTPAVDETGLLFRGIDANLGLDGLPQSGTGQATLLTGVNCAQVAGRHYGPYPHSKTRSVIAEKNVFARLKSSLDDDDEPCAFANVYPERFFRIAEERDRWTVTTRCCLDAGVRIRSTNDLRAGLAVPADLTGRRWPDPAEDGLMPRDESEAADRLLLLAKQYRFTLFEVFSTDKAGHSQSADRARDVLQSLDRLLARLLNGIQSEGAANDDMRSDGVDPGETLLIVTSDHGNLEDLSTKSHTRNPVPFAVAGRGARRFAHVTSLVDVTPAIVEALTPTPQRPS